MSSNGRANKIRFSGLRVNHFETMLRFHLTETFSHESHIFFSRSLTKVRIDVPAQEVRVGGCETGYGKQR